MNRVEIVAPKAKGLDIEVAAPADEVPLPSFSDPDTHLHLPAYDVNYRPSVDGGPSLHEGEPIGLVTCPVCKESDMDVDEISHQDWCPQYWVRSHDWWLDHPEATREYVKELVTLTGDPQLHHDQPLPARIRVCEQCGAAEWGDDALRHARFCPEQFD